MRASTHPTACAAVAGCLAVLVIFLSTGQLWAAPQPADTDSPRAAKPADNAAEKLALEQQRIAERFKHLEEVLLRMGELSAASDPRRAALLKKAVGQSKEQLLDIQFDQLVELLQKDQLSRAIENQDELGKNLQALLELLLSENRAKQLESQKKRYQEYLKRINALIKEQKNLQGRSGGSESPDRLSGEQGKLAAKTGGLAKDINKNEEPQDKEAADAKAQQREAPKGQQRAEGKGEPRESKKEAKGNEEPKKDSPGEGKKNGGQQQKEGQKAEQKDAGQKDAQQKDAREGKGAKKSAAPSKEPGKGSKGKAPGQDQDQQEAESQRDQQAEAQESPESNPARRRVQAAQDRMKEAEEKLRQAQREGAVDKQEEALRELEQAKAALEEILRQLREEEIQRMLAMLEVRFKKMLQMQREVHESTVRLDKDAAAERRGNQEIETGRLSAKEGQIVVEADKAYLLLREDGSAVVFPEAVEQARDDMQQIVLRLAQGKVEAITQAIELDVIAALEEMVEALQKAQKDRDKDKDRKKPPLRPSQGQPQEPPLVDVLAEIKMIRAMQMRVNTRTERYSKLIDGEQADKADLVQALQRLAERQQRIHRVTRDLELGRNQ